MIIIISITLQQSIIEWLPGHSTIIHACSSLEPPNAVQSFPPRDGSGELQSRSRD